MRSDWLRQTFTRLAFKSKVIVIPIFKYCSYLTIWATRTFFMLIASFHWYQRQTCLDLYYILVPSESIGFHLFSVMLVYKRCAYITNCASTQRSTISRSKYEPLLQYLRPLRPITLGAKYSLFVPNTQVF